jgi:pimeloyl-ACP methyl ester carboxylesterase
MKEPPNHIRMPTLLLWGVNDPALNIANADRDALLPRVPDLQVERLEAGHFVHLDLPDVVNAKIIAFLKDSTRHDGARRALHL